MAFSLLIYEAEERRDADQELWGRFSREDGKFLLLLRDSQEQVGRTCPSMVVCF